MLEEYFFLLLFSATCFLSNNENCIEMKNESCLCESLLACFLFFLENVKVRFFEQDEKGDEVWSDYGKFNDMDVHHQYAIVFK